jgi:acetyl-CoA carboxylase biotin carboxyl carrier protein
MDIVKITDSLAQILNEKNLGSLFVKNGEFEILLKQPQPDVVPTYAPAPVVAPVVASGGTPPVAGAVNPGEAGHESSVTLVVQKGDFIRSPIVGTFYSAPAPDKPPFVKIGDKITKGQVVCIVESMKLMNEITSNLDGTVAAILAIDGEAVDFDKELIRVE